MLHKPVTATYPSFKYLNVTVLSVSILNILFHSRADQRLSFNFDYYYYFTFSKLKVLLKSHVVGIIDMLDSFIKSLFLFLILFFSLWTEKYYFVFMVTVRQFGVWIDSVYCRTIIIIFFLYFFFTSSWYCYLEWVDCWSLLFMTWGHNSLCGWSIFFYSISKSHWRVNYLYNMSRGVLSFILMFCHSIIVV